MKETIFEGRFKHVDELSRMGADIRVDMSSAFIRGVPRLYGATVEATDLRAGAALVIAGLAAHGTTIVEQIHHIDRGYDRIEHMLSMLGSLRASPISRSKRVECLNDIPRIPSCLQVGIHGFHFVCHTQIIGGAHLV